MLSTPLLSMGKPRVVLDTNACLDLWVFRDPRASGLLEALHDRKIQAVTNDECRDEWLRVLHYPQLALAEADRRLHAAAYDALVRPLTGTGLQPAAQPGLPRCADPDDQKFLQLAAASRARWLVSRDAAVLALGRRTRRDGLFDIVAPQAWPASAAESIGRR